MENKAAEIYDAVADRAAFCGFAVSQTLGAMVKSCDVTPPDSRKVGIGVYLDWLETEEVKEKVEEEFRTDFLVRLWRAYEAENLLRIVERALGCDAISPPGLLSKHDANWQLTQEEIGPLPEVLL